MRQGGHKWGLGAVVGRLLDPVIAHLTLAVTLLLSKSQSFSSPSASLHTKGVI